MIFQDLSNPIHSVIYDSNQVKVVLQQIGHRMKDHEDYSMARVEGDDTAEIQTPWISE